MRRMTDIAFTEHTVALDSGPVTYLKGGEGRPILLLHSAGGPRVSPATEMLARRHTIYIPTVPGYNGTPVWNILGTTLANTGPASDKQIEWLTWIDPMFVLAMTLMAWWAFGWRTTCVALAVFATNFPSRFYWTGGAFLRWDWLFYFVGGLCLVKRNYPLLGGVFLGYSTLLRVFPLFVFTGPVLAMRAIEARLRAAAFAAEMALARTEYEDRDFSLVDVLRPGVSKGATLKDWARQRGYAREEVMAIGDNFNDVDMLEFSGVPVVMGNAVAELKSNGWRVAPSHDEAGVAAAIHEYALKITAGD